MHRSEMIRRMMDTPNLGFISVSKEYFETLPKDHRYAFVRLLATNKAEGFEAGDYALVDVDAKTESGDLIIAGDGLCMYCYRLIRVTTGWCGAPLRKSGINPMFLSTDAEKDEQVIGKVVKFFNMKELPDAPPAQEGVGVLS